MAASMEMPSSTEFTRTAEHQVQRHPEVLDRHAATALAQHAERIALASPDLRHGCGIA
jgi:hypothetical protein